MRPETTGRLVVLAPPELEGGFLLAGVEVQAVTDEDETVAALDRLLAAGMEGVVAVYEPFLSGLPGDRRRRLERSLTPVVVPIPTGLAGEGGDGRRARLLARLQRAIGYRVTFGEETS